MRDGWKRVKLGEVCKIRRGASPRPIQNYIQDSKKGGMPWVKIADATASDSRYIFSTNESIIQDGVAHSVLVEPETFILSNSATPGLPKIMKITACVHDGWLVLSDFDGIDRDFLYYKCHDIRRYLANQANGSVFQNLKSDIVRDFDVDLPPLPIQRRIAAVLGALDDKIELNRKMNANLEAQAQALFKSWFVDFDPWGGKMPSGWKKGCLREIVEVCYGKDHKKLSEGSVPVFGSGGLMRYAERALYDKESVLIPRKGTLNNIMYSADPFWTVDTMFYTKMRIANAAKFVYLFLNGKDMAAMNTGSAVPSMTTDILNSMEIVFPTSKELAAFEARVSSMFEKHKSNERESRKLAELRDALLPKLMSGELEVA